MGIFSLSGSGTSESEAAPPRPGGLRRIVRWMWRIVSALLLFFLGFHLWIAGQLWWWRTHNPTATAFMQQGLERLQERNPRARLKHTWVPYSQISVNLKRAVIAAEDQKFLDHQGFDWEAIEQAYNRNEQRQRNVRGGSTISQQLAKNLFLSGERSYARKAEEAIITLLLEQILDKRRILEIYLNVIEWGDGVYGVEAAAQHYYAVRAAELSPEQAAWLAAIIPAPRRYDRRRESQFIESRAQVLLAQMNWMPVP